MLYEERAAEGNTECLAAPNYIPPWVLPPEDLLALREAGCGAAPDLIYARGVPDSPIPPRSPIATKECSLLLIEVGFCRDLGCPEKRTDKTTKYEPLLAALLKYWGAVEFVCIPIGHAGTTLHDTARDLATALARIRPHFAAKRRRQGHKTPDVDSKALKHDKTIVKALLSCISSIAQDYLINILYNREKALRALDPHRPGPPFRPRVGQHGRASQAVT